MKNGVKLFLFCAISVAIVYRIAFDVAMYLHGATLEIRGESRSGYNYLMRIPPGYHAFSSRRPLLIYLHGAGETGKDITDLKTGDPSVWSREHVAQEEYPFITITPVTEIHGWNPARLKLLIDELISNRDRFKIDKNRIYLTGYSMGGFGTFQTAEEYPELFAAIAPIAGGGNIEHAECLKELPIWAFHGDSDSVVPYSCTAEMMTAIEKTGGTQAKLTTFQGADHGIVVDVYRNPKLYQWFLQQRRK